MILNTGVKNKKGVMVTKGQQTFFDNFYRYLSKIRTPGHAFMVSGIFAGFCSLASLTGTQLAFRDFESPIMPLVEVLAYFLPFLLVFGSSFMLIQGFSRLHQQNRYLSEIAHRDDLTRLANRAGFLTKGQEMVMHADIENTPLSLIMFDIDHFKQINDSIGHLAGDTALQHISGLLRHTCREFDLAARWGGEEFAIILQCSNIYGASNFAERLRDNIANSPFYWEGHPFRLTISSGVTEWSGEGDSFAAMVERADKALYIAKGEGRNRVRIAKVNLETVDGFELDLQFGRDKQSGDAAA
ncbi:GGDEF domain-containing protein [uncultured Cohaesibacter sp.]|uniref:GGDEF domain-containing protein n=1 Tax=uncultured Cohaesibacter sp. TaxID=1002546 RepID=UPI00292E93F7|nr:GGDEF domain-containing protein [uncultured Cohaesibacter sp.]